MSPYALHIHEELSPRASAWLYTSAVSIAGLSSLLVTEKAIQDVMDDTTGSSGRSSIDKLLIIVLSVSFALSLLITISYRHRSLREKLTADIKFLRTSFESVFSIGTFCIWSIVMAYVAVPGTGLNYGMAMITVDGYEEVWNTNVWLSAWLGWGLSTYLVGALLMASPGRKRGVWSVILEDFAPMADAVTPRTKRMSRRQSSRRGSNGSSDGNIGSEDRGYIQERTRGLRGKENNHNTVAYWFMLLSFSTALAVFSIELRAGDVCISVLSDSPLCKRASLGGGVGITCALLALAALLFYRMDQKITGSFDSWEQSKRERLVFRVEAALAFLSLVLQGVNLGYGTSPSGPSTEMNNLFVASTMGLILSLMICEQVMNGNVLRVWPAPSEGGQLIEEKLIEDEKDRNNGVNLSRHSSSSSDSSSSSSSSSSSDSSDADVERGSVRRRSENQEHESPTMPTREFISTTKIKRKNSSGSGSVKSSSSGRSSSKRRPPKNSGPRRKNRQEETSLEDDDSSYSLPKPPPIYASSPSSLNNEMTTQASEVGSSFPPSLDDIRAATEASYIPTMESSFPPVPPPTPPPPPHMRKPPPSNNDPPQYNPYGTSFSNSIDGTCSDEESGVELSFTPEDDISTLECSVMTSGGKEPDGYKSDDAYNPPPDGSSKPGGRSSKKSRNSWRNASNRKENRSLALAPVEEQDAEESRGGTSGQTPPTSPGNNAAKQTIEEIMNRGVEDAPPMLRIESLKSKKSKKQSSIHIEDESRVRRIARSFTQAASGSISDDSTNGEGGPPTVNSIKENDEAVKSTLNVSRNSRSFYSEDITTGGESGQIYES